MFETVFSTMSISCAGLNTTSANQRFGTRTAAVDDEESPVEGEPSVAELKGAAPNS